VYHHLGKVPAPGDEFQADGLSLQVLSVAGRRIRKLRVRKLPPPPPANGRSGKNGGNGS
jgi:CBS domain containing-hemolysin-like protein